MLVRGSTRESSKYIHSYNILLLVKCFYTRTKCAFVLGEIPNKVYLGGIDDMVQNMSFEFVQKLFLRTTRKVDFN